MLLSAEFSLASAPRELTPALLRTGHASLLQTLVVLGVGDRFSPVHLRRPQPRPVSCYALLGGWLLLSLPPGCFWLQTIFRRLHLTDTFGP